ncbi:MAG: vWA domain-containing protein [Candidatus Thiodiazotropha sp.]
MNKFMMAFTCLGFVSLSSDAIEIRTPQDSHSASIQITDPDRHVRTLGTVSFRIDLSAAHDDLLAHRVRHSDLRLKDGRKFTAFGVHKGLGKIVIAGGDVTHVSIAAKITGKLDSYDLSVLFYGADHQIIAPAQGDVAVFDKNLKPVAFDYNPVTSPSGYKIPVSIALDTSGSMAGHLSDVMSATRDFMGALPASSECQLYRFDDEITKLTAIRKNCNTSLSALEAPLKAGGGTALYKAIETGFTSSPADPASGFPNITIIVTDGVNTSSQGPKLSALRELKKNTNSRLFVFWVGNYKKRYLNGLADLEFVSGKDVRQELDRFFQTLGVSISGLQRIRIPI